VARQVSALIAAGILLAWGCAAGAADPKTPQTPWAKLSPEERRILEPVAPDWERLPGHQQQRLITSARRYPSLQPIQKERFDERVRDWATMTPEQRNAARETYQGLRKLPPEKQHELRERWLQQQRQGQAAEGSGRQRASEDGARSRPTRRGEGQNPR
jgi:hypothetical protein